MTVSEPLPRLDPALMRAGRVGVRRHGPVLHVLLDRPEARNAQTPATWRALAAVGHHLPPEVRVVVLRGAGASFSAGLDRAMLGGGLPGEPGLAEPRDARRRGARRGDRRVPARLHLVAPAGRRDRGRGAGPRRRCRVPGGAGLRPAGGRRRRAVRDARDVARAGARPRRHRAAGAGGRLPACARACA
nr:hypothetical protein [Angustibacter aerolatus]